MNKFFLLLVVVIGSVLFGCDSNTSDTSGGILPGDIVGRVALLDTLGKWIPDKSGVVVTIEHSPFSAISDSNGIFRLRSIPPGTHIFTYAKEGFSPNKVFNIQHTGNGTLYLRGYTGGSGAYDAQLVQIPTGLVALTLSTFMPQFTYRDTSWVDSVGKLVHSYVIDSSKLAAEFSIPLSGYPSTPFLYFAKDAQIDPGDPKSYSFLMYLRNGGGGKYIATVWADSLTNNGFTPGTQIFVKTARSMLSYYDDLETLTIVTTYGYFSEVRSFILP